MAVIGDGYGSECHLLRYLGRHRRVLDNEIRHSIGCREISWLDYPFDSSAPWKDREWKGLDFLPADSAARQSWRSFWPQRGNVPNWDAVGQVETGSATEWLLVEAKANVPELYSSCQASERGGLSTIRAAFARTKSLLSVAPTTDWLAPYYQYCNRVAVLNFMLEHSISARLLFVYFTGDAFPDGRLCPKDTTNWEAVLRDMDEHVGIPASSALKTRIHRLFLPICPA